MLRALHPRSLTQFALHPWSSAFEAPFTNSFQQTAFDVFCSRCLCTGGWKLQCLQEIGRPWYEQCRKKQNVVHASWGHTPKEGDPSDVCYDRRQTLLPHFLIFQKKPEIQSLVWGIPIVNWWKHTQASTFLKWGLTIAVDSTQPLGHQFVTSITTPQILPGFPVFPSSSSVHIHCFPLKLQFLSPFSHGCTPDSV